MAAKLQVKDLFHKLPTMVFIVFSRTSWGLQPINTHYLIFPLGVRWQGYIQLSLEKEAPPPPPKKKQGASSLQVNVTRHYSTRLRMLGIGASGDGESGEYPHGGLVNPHGGLVNPHGGLVNLVDGWCWNVVKKTL